MVESTTMAMITESVCVCVCVWGGGGGEGMDVSSPQMERGGRE